MDDMSVLALPALIEPKLASGISAPDRLQDLADVLELIRVHSLQKDFGAGLNDYVLEKYEELWQHAQRPKRD